jgi:hypothetical protein
MNNLKINSEAILAKKKDLKLNAIALSYTVCVCLCRSAVNWLWSLVIKIII